jgi:thioredoxin reductase/Fe-S-cluster-containing hydrogenase component 2
VPLLKFSSETGTQAIQAILAESGFPNERAQKAEGVVDVAIIGGGTSGVSAAMEAKKAGLSSVLIESNEMFSTVENFPKQKPIYTYPHEMTPEGGIQYGERSDTKESLLEEMREQVAEIGIEVTEGRVEKIDKTGGVFVLKDANSKNGAEWKALRVIVAIGRSGNYRKLGVPGEELDKVMNRLHDPADFEGQKVLVVGGGDSAMEGAVALAKAGAEGTLSYRGKEFSRPKPENVAAIRSLADEGKLEVILESEVAQIGEDQVILKSGREMENDVVFAMIGREAPLDFFRRSGLTVANDRNVKWWLTLIGALLFCIWLFHWKKGLLPGFEPKVWLESVAAWGGSAFSNEEGFLYTLRQSASGRDFYYSFVYCLCVLVFGIRRIRRRNTPYVTWQTVVLTLIQWIPLFILPYLLLPWMGRNGVFESGVGAWIESQFFPDGSYWRSFGFILAWPLAVFNWFTDEPIWGWLILGFIQTFVIIPWIVLRWGKGAYCGWICSCGALAETMGDQQRHKMPHGPGPNKLNMVGQVFLVFAAVIMIVRILGWIFGGPLDAAFSFLADGAPLNRNEGLPVLNYSYFVDLIFAGILGVAFYFHFSGRVWCRFACPLAALMHIYARFTKFRIFAEKKKCISCNVCTSVCHQGIDVMAFANKGKPMEDPQCVRCSACVQGCPTGVLSFGCYGKKAGGEIPIIYDKLPASRIQMKEGTKANEKTPLS